MICEVVSFEGASTYQYTYLVYGEEYKSKIHLTGAATNPWIRFEYDDSFIKFEIGTD